MTDVLTDLERELLQALADGESQKQYATREFRSYQAVKNRMLVIFEKFKAKNSAHAVAIALRKGLIR